MPDVAEAETERFDSTAAEAERTIRSATIWLAAGVIAPGVVLGPLLASGWGPDALPPVAAIFFWSGGTAAAAGLALLIWAGCPVLRSGLGDADRRKTMSVRIGIPVNVAGMAISLLVLLLTR